LIERHLDEKLFERKANNDLQNRVNNPKTKINTFPALSMKKQKLFDYIIGKLLSEHTKEKVEKIILILAIVSFLAHLIVIFLVNSDIISLGGDNEFFKSPIAAIYTPFSFILIYEVYLLVFYMPRSITTYVSKQYEIITLIVIRRLFKDFAKLELTDDWFDVKGDLQFTYDILLAIIVFFIIYLFKKNIKKIVGSEGDNPKFNSFIKFKRTISVFLIPVLIILASYSLINWISEVTGNNSVPYSSFLNINNIFFEEFFTVLIIVDVLLLLVSFFYTDSFHKVIRNSGFIISTILIRLSFSADGLLNNLLILSSILFGLLILIVHNQFEKLESNNETL